MGQRLTLPRMSQFIASSLLGWALLMLASNFAVLSTTARADAAEDEAAAKAAKDRATYGEELVYGNANNDNAVFLGGGLSFGQARSTDGESPGLVFLAKFEPGYQFKVGSWSRLEVGAELFTGRATFTNPDDKGGKSAMTLGLGVLAKAGYGYSLGNGVFGVIKVGVGPVLAKYSGEIDSYDVESDTVSGLATQLGYVVVLPMSGSLDFTGGISYTHLQFDVDKVEDNAGNKIDMKPFGLNMPQAEVGLRIRL